MAVNQHLIMNKKTLIIVLIISIIGVCLYFLYEKNRESSMMENVPDTGVVVSSTTAVKADLADDPGNNTAPTKDDTRKDTITVAPAASNENNSLTQIRNIVAKILKSEDQSPSNTVEIQDMDAHQSLGVIKLEVATCKTSLDIGGLYRIKMEDSQKGFYKCISAEKIIFPGGEQ